MKGFSTIEILIAYGIALSAIVATVLISFGIQPLLRNLFLEAGAIENNSKSLAASRALSAASFATSTLYASTTNNTYHTSQSAEYVDEDDLEIQVQATTTWVDSFGTPQEKHASEFLFDISHVRNASSCDTTVSGDWLGVLKTTSYDLSVSDLLQGVASDSYMLSGLAVTKKYMALSIGNTELRNSPTLFFFTLPQNGDTPVRQSATFDNAASSTIGFSRVAIQGDVVYAGNGFGSISTTTCRNGNCAQLHIFSLASSTEITRVATLALATNSNPYALTSSGATAAVTALTYRDGYVYIGLQKTARGQEFNIIDVHDPAKPVWRGGASIGRSINDITINRGLAYVSTDDPVQELQVFDVHDASNPLFLGSWNAPGSNGFGFGRAIHVHNGIAQFGRSYVNNAAELYSLAIEDAAKIVPLAQNDVGTVKDPRSVVSLLARGSYLYVLTDAALRLFSIRSSMAFASLRAEIPFAKNDTAIALACSGNSMFVGLVGTSTGVSRIEIITPL
jgi:hypothetical protein